HRLGAAALRGGVARQIPQIFLVVERLRVQHVVRTADLGLYAEEGFGIARMTPQIGGHLVGAAEQIGEQALVLGDDRVVGREDVHVGFAVVGVDGGLHRVADIVHAAHVGDVDAVRVGVGLGSGVAVDHPDQAPFVGDHQVGVGIPGEEAGEFTEAVGHLAVDHHTAVVGEIAGQQDVRFAFIDGGRQAHAEAGDGRPALAFVARGY